jgi:hypothetical protein
MMYSSKQRRGKDVWAVDPSLALWHPGGRKSFGESGAPGSFKIGVKI